MIVLDTNVISELMRPNRSFVVLEWMKSQVFDDLFTTAITQAEILEGLSRLPAGKRRDHLKLEASVLFDQVLEDRILVFDSRAAEAFAEIVSARRQAGRPIDRFDAQIAAITLAGGASLATRNVRDFTGCGLDVIDPWREQVDP